MMALVIEILSWIFMLAGAAALVSGAIGLIRFPDFWSRLHAVSIIDSAGVGFICIGMMLQSGATLISAKIALIALFVFITGPTASHALANAALVQGLKPKDLVEDDLSTADQAETTTIEVQNDRLEKS